MAKLTERERVGRWQSRVNAANKVYDEWKTQYRTDILEEYYQGHQWKEDDPEQSRDAKYVINLYFPSIEINLPNLLFYFPKVKIRPRPPRADDPGSDLGSRATLLQDVAQQLIELKEMNFLEETSLALFEAFFRFGIIETGYSADIIDNPNAGKPVMTSDGTAEITSSGEPVVEPSRLPREGTESIYNRRIPAEQFRVSAVPTNHLQRHDWVGYYDYVRPEDVKSNKVYKNRSKIRATSQMQYDESAPDDANPEKRGLLKIWKIWDLRAKKRYVFAENHDKFFMEGTPFQTFPFSSMMFHRRLDEWYPLPPTFNWLGPQNELNETREMQRIHRKRTPRKYSYKKGSYDPKELEKLSSGNDMEIIERKTDIETLAPIQDAPLDQAIGRNVPQTQQDFVSISGVSSEQRQLAESETATQAQIISMNARIRESKARRQVGTFLGDVVRTMLLTMREHFTLPLVIRATVDPFSPNAQQNVQQVAETWQKIEMGEIDGFDFDVDVEVESLSPLTEDAERVAWIQLLSMLNNPTTVYLLANSEFFLKTTLRHHGITSDEAVREFQQAAQGMLQLLQQGQGGPTAAPGPQGVPTGTGAPDPQQILSNLANQIGP